MSFPDNLPDTSVTDGAEKLFSKRDGGVIYIRSDEFLAKCVDDV